MKQGPVFFVGAGPGDPELITVKGQKLLRRADLVLYAGSLVPDVLVRDLDAEVRSSAGMDLDEITGLMAGHWRRGARVVRLHTGDPAVFGAIREQMVRLDELAIPYRVVPGVSSVFAAAASLRTELTLPGVSQTVIICRRAGRTPVPEREDLRLLAAHRATMMILLSVGMIEEVVVDLLAGGYPADTPAVVVEKAGWPEERVLRSTLSGIADITGKAGVTRTAIIAVGDVFAQQDPSVFSRLYDAGFSHGFRGNGSQGG